MALFFRFKALLLFFPLLSGCGIQQDLRIKGADLYTHEKNGVERLEMESVFSLGRLQLPNARSPIIIDSDRNIGEVDFQNLEDGTSRIGVSLNLKEAWASDSKLGQTLPNGRALPIALAENATVIGIPILEHSRIYLIRFSDGSISSGIAINIPAFDSIFSQTATALKFFKIKKLSKEFSVVSGIYSSAQRGLNGLAIFSNRQPPTAFNDRSPASSPINVESDATEAMGLLNSFRLNQLFQKNAVIKVK